ncbi:MAG TPA: hypothetical protein VFR24_25245 [Candidatus Angelobacter sp.]|nr:hypothetical protein [Candidatus Angelobacter sp.]
MVTRQKNITFGQTLCAVTWFPILTAILVVCLWKFDPSNVAIHYAKENLAVSITGLFGGWVIAFGLTLYGFRYIRNS